MNRLEEKGEVKDYGKCRECGRPFRPGNEIEVCMRSDFWKAKDNDPVEWRHINCFLGHVIRR